MIQGNLAFGNIFSHSFIPSLYRGYTVTRYYHEKHLLLDWKYESYKRLHFRFYYSVHLCFPTVVTLT